MLQVVNAVSAMLDACPEAVVDDAFGPVMHYLVQLVSCKRHQLATAACRFWAKHAAVPANPAVRRHWMTPLLPEMPTLLAALVDQMRYRPQHVEYLQSQQLGETASAASRHVKSLATLRNVATVAFEHLVRVYPVDLVCATFTPLLHARVRSSSCSRNV